MCKQRINALCFCWSLFGILNIIFFSPEDLDIIKRGPSERRRFVDLELCQLDKIYLNNLTNYNKILNQRNKRFYTTTNTWSMCIPYNEDTKHLIGTTNDCEEFYKTWK